MSERYARGGLVTGGHPWPVPFYRHSDEVYIRPSEVDQLRFRVSRLEAQLRRPVEVWESEGGAIR